MEMEEVYRSYYTKSNPIVSYMVQRLSVENGMRVFEPCAGDGVFIDALNNKIPNLSIDIYELNPEAISVLKGKYRLNNNITITKEDTLISQELILFSNAGGVYDRIIANPPYGGWQDYDKRRRLKKLYPGFYVKETYTLFLFRCTQLLRNGGLLVFIIPDTFLNLHMHTKLREYLLTNTKIKEIALFPSSFFPGVSFGYSNLCIITLQKCTNRTESLNNRFRVIIGFRNVNELPDVKARPEENLRLFTFTQKQIYKNIDHALFISQDPKITSLINYANKKIGDIAACVTGFYSGNDKKYLHPISPEIKNAPKYRPVDKTLISHTYVSKKDILQGIDKPKCLIPIVKGGGLKYSKPDRWYMDWSKEAVNHYRTDRKARFQNSQYYFKYGIAVPMVSSSYITAAVIRNRLFDQSIVGIFPEDPKWVYYLLALFNSPTCNKLIRVINPSTNNSANYIKKIPFIVPSKDRLQKINQTVKLVVKYIKTGKQYKKEELALHNLIKEIYGF